MRETYPTTTIFMFGMITARLSSICLGVFDI